jgi:hypothetical protein
MTKSRSDINALVRRIVGRNDSVDIDDATINAYINDFYQLLSPQEFKAVDDFTWLEFALVTDQEDYVDGVAFNLGASTQVSYSNLTVPAYIKNATGAASTFSYELNWYQDPGRFFADFSEDATNLTTGVPQNVLFYDKSLTMRPVPDDAYNIKIAAYRVPAELAADGSTIAHDYWFRFIAYGAAIDFLSDFGESDKISEVMPIYERYRTLVQSRTNAQFKSMRSIPSF